MGVWMFLVLSRMNLYKDLDITLCNNIKSKDLKALYGDVVTLILIFAFPQADFPHIPIYPGCNRRIMGIQLGYPTHLPVLSPPLEDKVEGCHA